MEKQIKKKTGDSDKSTTKRELTNDEFWDISVALALGTPYRTIAESFGISVYRVGKIRDYIVDHCQEW